MPLVSVDCAQLEWRVACQLANDTTGIAEIVNGVDYHTANAEQFFKDKSKRQDSKVLGFRVLQSEAALQPFFCGGFQQ